MGIGMEHDETVGHDVSGLLVLKDSGIIVVVDFSEHTHDPVYLLGLTGELETGKEES
jgi:hypothetical protein